MLRAHGLDHRSSEDRAKGASKLGHLWGPARINAPLQGRIGIV